ncbi:Helix-turn-helix domain-containing protein [Thermomonospora echinospora]|uniref:Helix-turn-helix domain-containing protein n=1 Tax=Thermomonospora echinospora TaxID=1992 RepID=A0A1H6D0X1_9ACTN|nr:helix-turn-helix transcriptional regulator [Thermomonospora echinospora]SEG79001.1 Helix-turn-helix domain-containing protein [Thermomonospora echinospora]
MERQGDEQVCPACRTTRLSRYNPNPLCGVCLANVRDGAGIVPVWLWDSGPLRQALARADMAAVLAILRAAAGMSQLEFGQLLGWSQSVVTKIERRKRDTFHDVREILRVADLLEVPRQALLPLILGRPDIELESDEDAASWGDAVQPGRELDRRQFAVMASGLALGAVLPAPKRVDRGHVRYLRACLEQLQDQDRIIGGASLRAQALRLFGRARAMLDESDYTEQVGRELLVVTADLGVVAAWLAYDSGDQATARALYGEAELMAGSAADNELLVHVYANMAQQATHLARITERRGRAREALRFADRAADAARHLPSPALHALIALRQAGAHAQLGDAVAFRASIGQARREIDRGQHETDQNWTGFVTHSEITAYEAMGAFQLGRPDTAAGLYQMVLEDCRRSPRDQVYFRARPAATLCAAGDRQGAVTEGLAVVGDLGSKLTSVRVLNELRPVRQAAGASAEEFCERFDAAVRILAPPSTGRAGHVPVGGSVT